MSGTVGGLPPLAAQRAGALDASRAVAAKDFQRLLDVADAPRGQPGHLDVVKDEAAPRHAGDRKALAAKQRPARREGAKDGAVQGGAVKARPSRDAATAKAPDHDAVEKDCSARDRAAAYLAVSMADAVALAPPAPAAGPPDGSATAQQTPRLDGRLQEAPAPREGALRADTPHRDRPAAATPEPGFWAAERSAASSFAAPSPGPGPSPLALPTPVAAAVRAEPPRLVDASQTLLQLAMADASLTVDVNRKVVNVALHTEATGALELEMRLHEGRASVLVAGPSAPLVAQHAPALREVLAQQGLSLGGFSMSQERRQRGEPSEPDAPTVSSTAAPASVRAPSRSKRHEGRIDLEA